MKRNTLLISTAALLLAAIPVRADVREGLVAYWPMNTATGDFPTTTPDVVGGNNMTGLNKPSADIISGGKFGNCVQFTGTTSDYLNFITAPGADTGLPVANNGSWSYALWVNGGSGQANQTTYFCETSSSNSSGNPRFAMEGNGANKTRYFLRDIDSTVKNQVVGSTNTLDSTWHHVAYTYEATTGKFLVYVDGQPDCTNTFTYAKKLASWDQVGVGALVRNTIAVPFNGLVDDVAVWGRALSQGEVQDVMTNSIATPAPAFKPVVTVPPAGVNNLFEGDNYTLSAGVYGTRPLSYQWTRNGTNIPGATLANLALSNITTNEAGAYRLVITNSVGSVTSVVAQVAVQTYGTANLTNGIVAYWPLDAINGVKTPEMVSAYDLTVNNMGASNVVAGKWGNALTFIGTSSQYARRIHNSGENLPIYSKSNFTVSLWVKGAANTTGWIFGECSTLQNNSAFLMGKFNSASTGLDGFCRDDTGTPSGDHRVSTGVAYDDTWHNIIWVQRDVGGAPKASLYIDGVLDPVALNPRYPITPNNTALGAFARATPAQFFTGSLDEVVIWNRPLSTNEIALVQAGYITNPPVQIAPLTINSFKSDLPGVAAGDSTVLRWDVPTGADTITISPIGNVAGLTSSGLGSVSVTPTQSTSYVLTITRTTVALGFEQAKATNTVNVVSGVATNWTLLDNFDSYNPGLLAGAGPWVDMYGNSLGVVMPTNCNRLVKTLVPASGAYLRLNNLTIQSNQSATLFFRMVPQGNPVSALRHAVGITDASVQFYYQLDSNVGPFVRPTINDGSQNPGDWLLAARDIPYSPLTFDTNVLQVGAVYSVWIDITNVFVGDRIYPDNYDTYNVYLQKEGDPGRTLVFANFTSDRDLLSNDPLTGGTPTDTLGRVYIGGNSDPDSALFDDFYLSKSGYNSTVPRAVGYAGPAPTVAIQWNGAQWQVVFQGKLEEATSVAGPWTVVTGATSPHLISATGPMKFYRAVCN